MTSPDDVSELAALERRASVVRARLGETVRALERRRDQILVKVRNVKQAVVPAAVGLAGFTAAALIYAIGRRQGARRRIRGAVMDARPSVLESIAMPLLMAGASYLARRTVASGNREPRQLPRNADSSTRSSALGHSREARPVH